MNDTQLYILLDLLGLPKILEQNDIEEVDVLEMLITTGRIDPEDYLYTDHEDAEEEL